MPKSLRITLLRVFRQSMVLVLVVVGVSLASLAWAGEAIASPFPLPTHLTQIPPIPTDIDINVGQAADRADRASDQIYEGLEETKEKIGKTEGRKEIIQKARDHASDKWQSLADKAHEAEKSNTELSPVDKHTLQHMNNGQDDK